MRNLLPSSRSLARTKTFFSSSFTVREDEFNDGGFVGGEDEELQQRRKSQHNKNNKNKISCAPYLDEEQKHIFVCLESGHMVRARCFVDGKEEEEEHNATTKRRMILLKDTEEEDEEENKSKSK